VEVQVKKPVPSILVLSLLALFVTLVLAETLIVKVQTTSLRKTPKFYGPVIQALQAGEKIEKITSQPDGWIQVKTSGGAVGWIHSSAVAVQKFDLMAMDKGLKTQASASEVALAGKGFNKQIEENYRAQHRDISFAEVDKMLLIKIAAAQLEEFMKQGRLGDWRGAK
jgi:hypothetical protein